MIPKVVLGLMIACASPNFVAARDMASATNASPKAPLRATLKVKQQTKKGVVLTARVEALAPLKQPARAVLTIPDGVTVLSGDTAFSLPAGEGSRETDITLAFNKTPAQDVLLDVESTGDGFALRAKDAYRFGRAAKRHSHRAATGPHLKVGTKDLGPSVPLN